MNDEHANGGACVLADDRRVDAGARREVLPPPPERVTTFAEAYRAGEQRAGACPIEAGVLLNLADNECSHGRLAGDRTPACGCWPTEVWAAAARERKAKNESIPAPDLIGALSGAQQRAKETGMYDDDIRPNAQPAPEPQPAPYGYKANGEPRKRPTPSAEHLAAAAAGRRRAQEAKRKTVVTTTANTGPALTDKPFVAQMLATIDAEIQRLVDEHERELARLANIRQTVVDS